MYYVVVSEENSSFTYYNKLNTLKLAEEYKNLLIMYFRIQRFRIRIRNNLNKTHNMILTPLGIDVDLFQMIRDLYNNSLTFEKFQEYFYNSQSRE
jgi:hypothetical protein